MELTLRIQFSELNINVNVLSALEVAALAQVEALVAEMAAGRVELQTVLQQSQKLKES